MWRIAPERWQQHGYQDKRRGKRDEIDEGVADAGELNKTQGRWWGRRKRDIIGATRGVWGGGGVGSIGEKYYIISSRLVSGGRQGLEICYKLYDTIARLFNKIREYGRPPVLSLSTLMSFCPLIRFATALYPLRISREIGV